MLAVAILGANGLIGNALATDLRRRGFTVRGMARRFTKAQRAALGEAAVQANVTSLSDGQLSELLDGADIVVNAIGVLQGPDTDRLHRAFAAKLAAACARLPQKLLIHLSVPDGAGIEPTAFSQSKRRGEAAIAASGAPFVILRPGFVVATGAYGGSALVRALAAMPFDLPRRDGGVPFAATAISDICETVAYIALHRLQGEMDWRGIWDVMEEFPGTVADAVTRFRNRQGGPAAKMTLPGWLMTLGAVVGDLASVLGWRPPVRSTTLTEMRRGVTGNPAEWMAATGIQPLSLRAAIQALPATVQETWFARLYLLKALALLVLVIFWCASGTIALTVAFAPARQILLDHGIGFSLAQDVTLVSSFLDISVGVAIAFRRSSRAGLIAGIILSVGYMLCAAVVTPDLWAEPLGAMVKTGPAIILMLFCLAIWDDR